MAQLVMKSAFEASKQLNLLQQSQTQNNTNTNQIINNNEAATINFVFSPAGGQNSFLNTFKHISSSASKISSLKQGSATPTNDSKNVAQANVRASPRSLKQNSKRKLDLNALLDQMPDKEFVTIEEKCTEALNCNLLDKYDTADKDSHNKFKKPLTEHQKEVRKQKSFIPLEIQSVCSGLEPTMDSQMSFTNDYDDSMQSQSMCMYPTMQEQVNSRKSLPNLKMTSNSTLPMPTKAATEEEENANDPMDLDAKDDDDYLLANMDMSQAEKRVSVVLPKIEVEEEEEEPVKEKLDPKSTVQSTTVAASVPIFNLPGSIKFHSKINPQKQIELVEVNLDTNKAESSPPSSYGSVASSFEVNLTSTNATTVPSIFIKEVEAPSSRPSPIVEENEIKESSDENTTSNANEADETKSENNSESKRRSSARLSRKSGVLNSTMPEASDSNCKSDKTDSTCNNDITLDKAEKTKKVFRHAIRRLKNNKNLFRVYMNDKRKKKAASATSNNQKHSTNSRGTLRFSFKSKSSRTMNKFTIK
jgi:hypothetical protein